MSRPLSSSVAVLSVRASFMSFQVSGFSGSSSGPRRFCIANAQSLVFLAKLSGLITRRVSEVPSFTTRRVSEGPSPGKTHMGPSLTLRVVQPAKFAALLSVSEAVTDTHPLADASGYGFDGGRRPGQGSSIMLSREPSLAVAAVFPALQAFHRVADVSGHRTAR